ncbi:DUF2510 domain-containing protein [Gordonia rubripertincta]|uniref:DUF2510 domain-containing protein n=2 Tax=Gordonia rubripertincta TaxID=36822 RepID=A0AAW6R3M5_GORRU|nr:DUF2510 domain-containing protein [Gordonia rubripertincta]MDG6780129.1 DUF2510 domain-containing protein [Gordonia rubripertincta]NKY63416.1 DUF2510 domain-containing protein [Gordonia rubripertincta]GAB84497.1 hypothetical protein GORBP_039_02080 [Gordonia rubripertincta NBRC 101908]
MNQPPPPPTTPPGWYVDPGDPSMLRWWDGRQWTDNWQLVPQQPKKSGGIGKALLIVGSSLLAVFVVLGGCAALIAGSSSDGTDSDRTPAARERAAEPSEDSRAGELERQRRKQELERLTNKASYRPATTREWQLIAKDPNAHKGELYVIYGRVVQADSVTGSSQMRVNTDGQQVESAYDFDINTVVTEGLASFKQVVEDDLVAMWVSVEGDETYTTMMGGSLTAPKVEVNIIEVYGSSG